MAKSSKAYFVQNTNNVEGEITDATGANTKVAVFTAGAARVAAGGSADDAVIKSFGLVSTDATARTVQIFVSVGGGADRLIGTVAVAANAGNNGTTAAVDVLRNAMLAFPSLDAYTNKVLNLKAGSVVKIAATAALAAGAKITAFGEGGDY